MSRSRQPFAHVVIRASAGTGKTFQLTNRFLRLLLAGEAPDEILATTFTRKAAGEILDRLLVRLAGAAHDRAQLVQLARDLESPALDRRRCLDLLSGLLRQLHRLRVGTLDSFFLQMARSFGLELGLPPAWQIVDDLEADLLREEAVRSVLHAEATSDLARLVHLLSKGEAARSVRQQIAELVKDLYAVYLEAPASAWSCLPRWKPLAADALQAAAEALAHAPCPDHKQFQRARDDLVRYVEEEDWESLLRNGLIGKIVQEEETYCRNPIPKPMREACQRLVRHARAMVLGRIANQTEATRRLLERFDAAYQRLRMVRRALRFEDVARALTDPSVATRLHEIAYRLDAHVNHLLLDEFQDTAPLQWRVLRPFAQRIVNNGRSGSVFCVGDVKQAIYGWRGGVAEIFDTLDAELGGLHAQSLDTSYRSSPVVIDTVNRVFGNLVGNAALEGHAEAARRWAARFSPHATAKRDLPGCCRLVAAPRADQGQPQKIVTWQFAVERIRQLHAEAPERSIGVLVRRNEAVGWLIRRLRQLKIEASEEGGNPLIDSPAVQWVVSLLRLADHPGHSAARFHVAHSPLGPLVGLADFRDEQAAVALSRRLRSQLMEVGYGPTLYQWARHLAPHCDARELSRLLQLAEMGYSYESRATTRVDDFVRVVEQQRVETPRRAAVRVMNIHQAKGLEFDLVVLPELDVPLTGQTPQLVVARPQPAEPICHVLRYVSHDLWPLLPKPLQQMFQTHQQRVVEESLCLLYVGLTRARHAVEMIVAPSARNEKKIPATFAGVLRAALTSAGRLEPEAIGYLHGDPDWHRLRVTTRPAEAPVAAASPAIPPAPPTPTTIRLAPSTGRLSRGLDRRSPSQLEGGARVELAQHLRLEGAEAAQRGTILHAWFEQIEWLDQGEPADAALLSTAVALALAESERALLVEQFRSALRRPAIRELLTLATFQRPAPPGSCSAVHARADLDQPRWQVWRELPFALREDDVIVSGRIDRLVVLYDGMRPIGAEVVDFKTDAIPADDPAALQARTDFYRPQLDAYRRAAANLTDLKIEKVSARLVFTEPGVIASVGP